LLHQPKENMPTAIHGIVFTSIVTSIAVVAIVITDKQLRQELMNAFRNAKERFVSTHFEPSSASSMEKNMDLIPAKMDQGHKGLFAHNELSPLIQVGSDFDTTGDMVEGSIGHERVTVDASTQPVGGEEAWSEGSSDDEWVMHRSEDL